MIVINHTDYNQYLTRHYSQATSNMESPVTNLPAMTPGQTWKVGLTTDYGTEISQLVELDPYTLDIPEGDHTSQETSFDGRWQYAKVYADWLRQGLTPPPVDVVQIDSGKLRVVDGHRRVAAAKIAGQKVLAWVSWSGWYRNRHGQFSQSPQGFTLEQVNGDYVDLAKNEM